MSRNNGAGGLGMVLVGMALGAGLTVGGLWVFRAETQALQGTQGTQGTQLQPIDSGRPRTLEERMRPVQAACQREYGYDPDAAKLCTIELQMQVAHEMSEGTAPEAVERLERARRAAGMR